MLHLKPGRHPKLFKIAAEPAGDRFRRVGRSGNAAAGSSRSVRTGVPSKPFEPSPETAVGAASPAPVVAQEPGPAAPTLIIAGTMATPVANAGPPAPSILGNWTPGERGTAADAAPLAAAPLTTETKRPSAEQAEVSVASKPVEPSPETVLAPASPAPAVAQEPGPAMPAQESKASVRHLSRQEAATVLARGDAVLRTGDVTSARLFYLLAAEGGDSTAALRLGMTFDPAFLQEARLGHVVGDLPQALHWYRRSSDLGSSSAEILLRKVETAGR